MDVDDSFAEYAAARWAALYRLAVLLAGADRAEDVTQEALLRAYRSWSRVQDAWSPDAYVKKILVNTIITEGKRGRRAGLVLVDRSTEADLDSAEDGVVDRELIWGQVEKLPPRQRAVIVLRYYEDLSEAEIARTLDCATGTVKAHASAALRTLRAASAEWLDAERPGGRHD
ncbi:MAG: SigE family polymerase sigma factor [Marmoricola sp.]|nr:SigE family polymerase sigma factor [Marmoricola sp.]